jgi:hypothetical protein
MGKQEDWKWLDIYRTWGDNILGTFHKDHAREYYQKSDLRMVLLSDGGYISYAVE